MNRYLLNSTTLTLMIVGSYFGGMSLANAQQSLYLAYPPNNHETKAEQIFFIGTASPQGEVLINGQRIQRSRRGHFAPSFPLKVGKNEFILQYNQEEIKISVNRLSAVPKIAEGVAFVDNSLVPSSNISRLLGEPVCFSAMAASDAKVSVKIHNQTIPLLPQLNTLELPHNSALLTNNNQPINTSITKHEGCTSFSKIGQLENPKFELTLNNQTITQLGTGTVEILSPHQLEIVKITADKGVTRTGSSTDYSRLTPLPQGTIAAITAKEGEWLRLDYGAWIHQNETQSLGISSPPKSLIKSIQSRLVEGATEIIFPLQIPVPIIVKQESNKITLILHNTTAQTDTIRFPIDPIIKNLTWEQVTPNKIEYAFELKSKNQWGYDLKYEGTNLIFSLRHPPNMEPSTNQSLKGIKILLDPGHGGQESGAKGPNGYPEKSVNLSVSQLLKQELVKRGATVYMTRETDKDVSLQERVNLINKLQPTLSLSIHYNALPDGGDAMNTDGIGMFWYHPQAQDLSVFLHDYLTEKLNRPSYGVFWNNLALTRPHSTPSILLELGFMINPNEFEWIINDQEQQKLAKTLADGITKWFEQNKS
ncbi:cell wall hydrolase/autolysin [Rippkaea orientalis PCC 8801]|uniref:Cell wall hydrolase/autolysin n=1 Tax=Rippkaea orientalis (strain PCC 8801 / RF-1) TaxID=41431 RepID=B7JX60_RIPO1|nr:N-acetylmuramoyl-L-alanine amidase [Rippkaea orientalis]ACK67048.1 cell wall hydrolase/autolysin [Rippkaea orientalis PCC 8801]